MTHSIHYRTKNRLNEDVLIQFDEDDLNRIVQGLCCMYAVHCDCEFFEPGTAVTAVTKESADPSARSNSSEKSELDSI